MSESLESIVIANLKSTGLPELDLSTFKRKDFIFPNRRRSLLTKGEMSIKDSSGKAKKMKVVLKTINKPYTEDLDERQKEKLVQYFAREAGIWRYSESHANILRLFGYVQVPGQILPSLVIPYSSKGSARAYVRRPENRDLPARERIRLARDIARGLEFLHSLSPAIVHRDVRATNVLVEEINRSVKGILIDFGSAKLFEIDAFGANSTSSYSVAWMPPEYILNPADYSNPTTYGDIWSLACTCYEIFTGQDPYPRYVDLEDAHAHGDTPARPPSEYISDPVWEFLQCCWNSVPQNRPTAKQAASRLRELTPW
ncbi:hypothetical protein ACEPAG_3766 [Sanghuangporus baumii]